MSLSPAKNAKPKTEWMAIFMIVSLCASAVGISLIILD
jgi:hypothetical protein